MDEDLQTMTREELMAEARQLRQGIRVHRDSTGHELCWHHPALWGLLPERQDPLPVVPEWPVFLRGCIHYRQSLDAQLPDAPRSQEELREPPGPARGGRRPESRTTAGEAPLACDLSQLSAEERRREKELLAWFKGAVVAVEETDTGWRYFLPSGPAELARVGELLALERLCCPFLELHLEVSARQQAAVHIGGRPDTKALVAAEFGGHPSA